MKLPPIKFLTAWELNNLKAELCAVTKYYTLEETQEIVKKFPQLYCIAENRWPDCEEKFKYFSHLRRHFIGPLQSNKIRKVLPLVDCIQSVDSAELIKKIDHIAGEMQRPIEIYLQVNISNDPTKHGLTPDQAQEIIGNFDYKNTKLTGLMTIGEQSDLESRRQYFRNMKAFFDDMNKIRPLKNLSMGMSEDYQIAIEEGATMVRLGKILQES